MKHAILNISDWHRYVEAMNNKLTRHFKPFDVETKDIKDTVSRNQQCYIFGAIYPRLKQALIDIGYEDLRNITERQFDYFMRGMFYFDIVRTSKGETKIPRPLNFEKGKKGEVSGYIEDLLQFASKIGCYIPGNYNILV